MSSDLLSDDAGGPTAAPGRSLPPPLTATLSARELRLSIAASQHELIRAQRRLMENYAHLERLESARLEPGADRPEGIEVVRDRSELRRLSARLCEQAAGGCRVLHGESGEGQADEHPFLVVGATGHRTVCARSRLEDPHYRRTAERAGRSGHRCRAVPTVQASVQIAGGAALLALRPRADGQCGLLLRRPELVELLSHHFDMLWSRALPVVDGERPPTDQDPLNPSEVQLQILRLAAVGAKDDSIARSLGRSTRWVRRHFEVLEERLGATNRMTLGIAAARRGWI